MSTKLLLIFIYTNSSQIGTKMSLEKKKTFIQEKLNYPGIGKSATITDIATKRMFLLHTVDETILATQ